MKKLKKLDTRLKERIESKKCGNKQKIYMHFSDKEHTYSEHIKDLLECLKENEYNVECDIADYTNHSDISYYFPDYLTNTIKQIL